MGHDRISNTFMLPLKSPSIHGRGRPKKDAKPTGYHYFIDATPYTDLEKVKLAKV